MNIGKSTKVALAQRGKDIKWLTAELGVTRQRAHEIAKSEGSSTATIDKLAKAFNLKASDFIALGEVEFE